MVQLQDVALLQAARDGDREALDALLRLHLPRVYRFGVKMCRDQDDAQDVLQDTLFAASRGLRGFRGTASFSTWLYAIARSFCIKRRRRSVYAPEIVSLDTEAADQGDDAPDAGADPERLLSGRQLAAALAAAIAALPPAHREALVLTDLEGMPAAEAASAAGVGVRALKSRLHRARSAVRARVRPLIGPAR
jgi:RNA polymerase sigma-70 factor (ECF subfamily)